MEESPGWGLSPFNLSLAGNISRVADQLLQSELSTFLSNPSRAVDITPHEMRTVPCSSRQGFHSAEKCERKYFVAGGIDLTTNGSRSKTDVFSTDVVFAGNQQGYILHFKEGDPNWQFNDTIDCQIYGFPFAAFKLCL